MDKKVTIRINKRKFFFFFDSSFRLIDSDKNQNNDMIENEYDDEVWLMVYPEGSETNKYIEFKFDGIGEDIDFTSCKSAIVWETDGSNDYPVDSINLGLVSVSVTNTRIKRI